MTDWLDELEADPFAMCGYEFTREQRAELIRLARIGREAERGWQPIETAPKGPDVLVWCADTREQFVAFQRKGQWIFLLCGNDDRFALAPTHWRPLPTPPAGGDNG